MKFLLTLVRISLLMPFFLVMAPGAFAQNVQNCAQIKDPDDRLACYDDAYRARGKAEPSVQPKTPPAPAESTTKAAAPIKAEPVEKEQRVAEQRLDEATAPSARPGSAAPATEEPRSRGMFSRREKVEFSATISAVRAREQQRMVFLLDNEQVWMQSTPRAQAFRKGDQVTIKSGLIGGFMMRNENGVGSRVQRIK